MRNVVMYSDFREDQIRPNALLDEYRRLLEKEFSKYKATPEFQIINAGMDVDGFKDIFYLEYCHIWLETRNNIFQGIP